MNNLTSQSRSKNLRFLSNFLYSREIQICFILIIAIIVLGSTSPFLSVGNIRAISVAAASESIVAIGMTFLLISGGFDLSVGSVFALGGIIAGLLSKMGFNPFLCILAGIAVGLLAGLINGLIITKIGINSLITTLGMLGIARGMCLVLTKGVAPSGLPSSFKVLGQTLLFNGIQLPIIIMLVFVLITSILLTYARFFRQFYFMGGNEKAALLTGIKTKQLRLVLYVISGGLAAFGGIIFASRIGAPTLSMGEGMELTIMSACVIGGCSIEGGKGSILGSFLGVILLGIVANAFNIFGLTIYWQKVVAGLILIIAVTSDGLISKRGGGI
jgi:ribose transport system permease protein